MGHPQPAFDFMRGLPADAAVEEYLLMDWWAHDNIEAGSEDDIVDHPEVWDTLVLPNALAELTPEDYVTIQPFDGQLNLNAIAIGFGLEDVRYSPEEFSGVVYCPDNYDATAILCCEYILFAVGQTAKDASGLIEHTIEKIKGVELGEPEMFDQDTQTGHVSDFSGRS